MSLNKFEKLKNKIFNIDFGQEQMTQCELIEVKAINSQTLEHVEETPFTLVFESEGDTIFDQNTYIVSSDELQETAMFLVPIAADKKGVRYEAIFT